MRRGHFVLLAAVGTLAMGAAAGDARAAATTVNIELQDPTTGPAIKDMHMKLDRASAPSGQVTFQVKNESKSLVHEMIVVKGDKEPSALPYDEKKNEVNEDKIKSLGEVSELPPGKSGHLTLNLAPGAYFLFCNQAGHLHGGMWSKFEVVGG